MVWHGLAWHGMAWHGMEWLGMARHDMISRFFCSAGETVFSFAAAAAAAAAAPSLSAAALPPLPPDHHHHHCLPTGKGRAGMLLLKNTILPRILLRRTKVQCADVLALPPR